MQTTRQIFADNFRQSICELIECYTGEAVSVAMAVDYDDDLDLSAIVGLCDESFRASVALTCNSDMTVSRFNVAPSDAPDWLGEFCNQLAGRLKNKLAVFGLQPNLSTPTTVVGQVLKISSRVGDHCLCQVTWGGGKFFAQLSLDLDEELHLVENKSLTSMAEGSLQLF